MMWGAVNELTTLTAYHALIRRCDHPVLHQLLRKVIRDERRHFAFYRAQAKARMQRSRTARRLVRWVLSSLWTPVGAGVKTEEEVDALAIYLFGDGPAGREQIREIDRTISEIPGLEGLTIVEDYLDAAPSPSGGAPRLGRSGPGLGRAATNGDAPAPESLGQGGRAPGLAAPAATSEPLPNPNLRARSTARAKTSSAPSTSPPRIRTRPLTTVVSTTAPEAAYTRPPVKSPRLSSGASARSSRKSAGSPGARAPPREQRRPAPRGDRPGLGGAHRRRVARLVLGEQRERLHVLEQVEGVVRAGPVGAEADVHAGLASSRGRERRGPPRASGWRPDW